MLTAVRMSHRPRGICEGERPPIGDGFSFAGEEVEVKVRELHGRFISIRRGGRRARSLPPLALGTHFRVICMNHYTLNQWAFVDHQESSGVPISTADANALDASIRRYLYTEDAWRVTTRECSQPHR